MRALRAAVDRLLETLLAALFAAMTLDVAWQVATRFLLARPSPFSEELARFLLIWLGLLGAAYALGRRMHLAIDLWPHGRRWRCVSRSATVAATLAFALAVLGAGGAHLVRVQLELGQRSAALGIPVGWVYTVLPIAGGLMAFYAIAELVAPATGEDRG